MLLNTLAPVLVYATSVFAISILTGKPWLWLPTGIMIIILVICIYFIGDALRDAMDQRNTERS